jgi:hypothetical protein
MFKVEQANKCAQWRAKWSAGHEDLVQSVDKKICERQRFTISELSCEFTQISLLFTMRLLQLGYTITSFAQDGFQKCSWVCTKCIDWLQLDFFEWYHRHGDELLIHIIRVTDIDTWVSFVNVETKEQSKQWMYTHSPQAEKV